MTEQTFDGKCRHCEDRASRVDPVVASGRVPRLLSREEIDEIRTTQGCSFGDGADPYWLEDVVYTLNTALDYGDLAAAEITALRAALATRDDVGATRGTPASQGDA